MSGLQNSTNVLVELNKASDEFGAHTGVGFPVGSKERRKLIGDIVKSGEVDLDNGSLREGLRHLDVVAQGARRRAEGLS